MNQQTKEPDGGPGQRTDAQLQKHQDLIRTLLETARNMISVEDARAVLARFDRSETIAPFVMKDISAFARDLRTFVAFRAELEKQR